MLPVMAEFASAMKLGPISMPVKNSGPMMKRRKNANTTEIKLILVRRFND